MIGNDKKCGKGFKRGFRFIVNLGKLEKIGKAVIAMCVLAFIALSGTQTAEAETLVNVALNKSAKQSSTAYGGRARRAVDGDIDGDFKKKSVSHTRAQFQPWWQVDLGSSKNIHSIVLSNRTDCCTDRLSNFKVMVSDKDSNSTNFDASWTETITETVNGQITIEVGQSARYVRIQLNGTNFLSLAEVQVMESSDILFKNVARGKNTKQSSTAYGGRASRAVDGNIDGRYRAKSLTHTRSQFQPWWQVDLASAYDISSIRITNRSDCCTNRLADFTVMVGDEDSNTSQFKAKWSKVFKSSFTGQLDIQLPTGTSGRYVRVQLNGSNFLSLAEVEVLTVDNSSVYRNIALGKRAKQSSTYQENTGADRAIDGNNNGDASKQSISQTNLDDKAWWQVDLLNRYDIDRIVITTRSDCCSNRLSNFKVMLGYENSDDASYDEFWTFTQIEAVDGKISIPVNQQGRYMRIQLNDKDYLALAEVEVFTKLDLIENFLLQKRSSDQYEQWFVATDKQVITNEAPTVGLRSTGVAFSEEDSSMAVVDENSFLTLDAGTSYNYPFELQSAWMIALEDDEEIYYGRLEDIQGISWMYDFHYAVLSGKENILRVNYFYASDPIAAYYDEEPNDATLYLDSETRRVLVKRFNLPTVPLGGVYKGVAYISSLPIWVTTEDWTYLLVRNKPAVIDYIKRDGDDLKIVASLDISKDMKDATGIHYDPVTRQVYVVSGESKKVVQYTFDNYETKDLSLTKVSELSLVGTDLIQPEGIAANYFDESINIYIATKRKDRSISRVGVLKAPKD